MPSPWENDRQRRQAGRFARCEVLEARWCPAVTFEFDAGVLHVTGDDGPNVVALFQPADRAVVVTGDGQSQTFSGVDEILVDTGDGDDHVMSSKPKEIVVVGSKIKIDVGAGNDKVTVDDGGPSPSPVIFNASMTVAVDLGTGADKLDFQIRRHDDVELDVLTSDGGDGVQIGMLLPAVQKVREAAARVRMELVGGGNAVSAMTHNVDDVALSLHAASPTGTAKPADDRYTFVFDGNAHATFPEQLQLDVGLSAADDAVSIVATEFPQCTINLETGDGDDSVAGHVKVFDGRTGQLFVDLGAGNDRLALKSSGFADSNTRLALGEGNDDAQFQVGISFLQNFRKIGDAAMDIDLGAGDDRLTIDSRGIERVTGDIRGGDGNDEVNARYKPLFAFTVLDLDSHLDLNLDLGAGDDRLLIESAAYADIANHLVLGDGDDVAQIRHRMFAIVDRSRLSVFAELGAGSDALLFDSFGYQGVMSDIDTGPAGDGHDLIRATHIAPGGGRPVRLLNNPLDGGADRSVWVTVGFFEVNQSQTEPTRQITVIQDL